MTPIVNPRDAVKPTVAANPTVTLRIGLPGAGKTTALIEACRREWEVARRDRRLGTVLFLVPTRRAQQAILDRMLSDGENALFAPQVLTFDAFAETILTAAGRPATPMSPVMKRLLLRRIVQEMQAEGGLPAFESVVQTTGFLDVVSGMISELKRDEVWPEEFLKACDSRPRRLAERDRQLGTIYQRYQRHLEEQNWYDNEGRFWLARTALAEGVRGPFSGVSLLVVDGFADFTRTQHEILAYLIASIERTEIGLTWEQPTSRVDLFAKTSGTVALLREHLPENATLRLDPVSGRKGVQPDGQSFIVNKLFTNPRQLIPANDAEGLELITATGAVGEREAVARRIKGLLAAGISPSEIVVATRSLGEDGSVWQEFLGAAGIPVWSEAVIPLSASPVVKTVFTWLQLELEDWPFDRLMSVLDSNHFEPTWDEFAVRPAIRSVAASLRRMKLHRGRELMLRSLTRVAKSIAVEGQGGDVPSLIDDTVSGAASDVASQATLVTESAKAAELLSRLSQVLERFRHRHTLLEWANVLAALADEVATFGAGPFGLDELGETERRDWDLLQRILRTAAETDEALAATAARATNAPTERKRGRQKATGRSAGTVPSLDLAEFTAELKDLLASETIKPPPQPAGCVLILDIEQTRHLRVPHLFLVGLIESSFPRSRAEDCLFSEADRRDYADLGITLKHQEIHQQDEMFLFFNVVTKAERQLVLSHPVVNARGQPVFGSPYVTALRTLFQQDALVVTQEGQLDPVPSVDRVLTMADVRMASVVEARSGRPGLLRHLSGDQVATVRAAGRNLLATFDVASQRFHERGFTSHEGRLAAAQNLKMIRQRFGARHQFSATELESYAECPFRFWMRNVLNIDRLDSPEEGTDHAGRGNLVHDVLATLLEEGLGRAPQALAGRFQELIEQRLKRKVHETELQRVLTEIESEVLGQWGDSFSRHQEEYARQLEAAWHGAPRSLAPELPFGSLPDAKYGLGEQAPEPLVFGNDESAVRVRGRIDRVDVGSIAGNSVYTIIDYKTGRAPRSNEAELRKGLAIQLALYAVAVRRLGLAGPDAVPFQMGYWSLKESGFQPGYQRKSSTFEQLSPETLAALETILDELVPGLAEGLRSGSFVVDNADPNCTGRCAFRTVCRVNQIRPLADSLAKHRP